MVARRGEIGVDPVEHLLGGGQGAGGLEQEHAVAAGAQHVQLAVGADVVDAGVGPGVGEEDEPLVEAEGEAVGHQGLASGRATASSCGEVANIRCRSRA